MDLKNIIDIVTNNGIGIACIIYFMYRDNKFMNTINKTLIEIELLIKEMRGGKDENK